MRFLALLVLLVTIAGAQVVIEPGGTHWWVNGRTRTGPTKFNNLGTEPMVLAGNGTRVYCSDCLPTCPATQGPPGCDVQSPLQCGADCVHEAGVWDCCKGISGLCPTGQCLVGTDPVTFLPVCTPCACSGGTCQPLNCPTGQILTAVTGACEFTCTPLVNVCCAAGLICCPGLTTTTTATTVTTSTVAPTSTTTTLLFNPSTTFLDIPDYPSGGDVGTNTMPFAIMSVGHAAQMYCARFVTPAPGIASATKIAWRCQSGTAFAASWVGIYPDSNSGTLIAGIQTGGPPACVGNPGTTATITVGAFSLVAGTIYRMCICGNFQNQITYEATNVAVSNGWPLLQNKFVTSVGTAANDCGVPGVPNTTGAITADPTIRPPIFHLSVE